MELKQRKMVMVGRVVSFVEAEEIDLEYYAGLNWKQSAATVEEMRRGIWRDAYSNKQDRTCGRVARLNDGWDDFE